MSGARRLTMRPSPKTCGTSSEVPRMAWLPKGTHGIMPSVRKLMSCRMRHISSCKGAVDGLAWPCCLECAHNPEPPAFTTLHSCSGRRATSGLGFSRISSFTAATAAAAVDGGCAARGCNRTAKDVLIAKGLIRKEAEVRVASLTPASWQKCEACTFGYRLGVGACPGRLCGTLWYGWSGRGNASHRA